LPPPPPSPTDPTPGPIPGGAQLGDFYAYLPGHKYIYVPTRELWPADSVNECFPAVEVGVDAVGKPIKVKPSVYLARTRPVEQMTWLPSPPHEPPVIRDLLINEGGWSQHPGATVFNLYLPPPLQKGNPNDVEPWLNHIRKIYPEDANHIIRWFAHRVQKPWEKINHALVLGGPPRIGKDTMIEPVKRAIGAWNFKEASPTQVMGQFNDFLKGVILRINETRDLGDSDRYTFYEHMKPIIAAPPDVLRMNEKHIPAHPVFNVVGVIETTNYKSDGMYLPANDGRHYVAWSEITRDDFPEKYFNDLWMWLDKDGAANIAAYLAQPDLLKRFDPKAPPPKTPAFWEIVSSYTVPEQAELQDILDKLDQINTREGPQFPPPQFVDGQQIPPYEGPRIVTLKRIIQKTWDSYKQPTGIGAWLQDRRNSRTIPHRMEACGYVPVRNDADKRDGQWKINGTRQTVYGKSEIGRGILISLINHAIKDGVPF